LFFPWPHIFFLGSIPLKQESNSHTKKNHDGILLKEKDIILLPPRGGLDVLFSFCYKMKQMFVWEKNRGSGARPPEVTVWA
jgi:hypothetical protein